MDLETSRETSSSCHSPVSSPGAEGHSLSARMPDHGPLFSCFHPRVRAHRALLLHRAVGEPQPINILVNTRLCQPLLPLLPTLSFLVATLASLPTQGDLGLATYMHKEAQNAGLQAPTASCHSLRPFPQHSRVFLRVLLSSG